MVLFFQKKVAVLMQKWVVGLSVFPAVLQLEVELSVTIDFGSLQVRGFLDFDLHI